MKCPYCGIDLPDDELVCPACGNMVGRGYVPSSRRRAPKRRVPAAAIVIPAVLILLGGFGAVFFMRKKPAPDLAANVETAETDSALPGDGQDQTPETIQNTEQPEQAENPDQAVQPEQAEQIEQAEQTEASEQDDPGEAEAEDPSKGKGAADVYDSPLYYFRTLLEGEELELYDLLYDISRADTDHTEEKMYVSMNPGSEEFTDMFGKARSFMSADHPELFYISTYHYNYYDTAENGKYEVTITSDNFTPSDHLQEVGELEGAAESILSELDTSQSAPQIALALHDRILDLVQYDYETYESESEQYNILSHSAYGALVKNDRGEANTAVCSGYAAAYEYLLQKAGIKSTIVNGTAWADGQDADSHTWNLVELDGDWYETDCTWDDNVYDSLGDVTGDILVEAVGDEDYVNTIVHYLFNVTTERMEDFEPGDDYTFYCDKGSATFLGSCGRSRVTQEEAGSTRDFATPFAPIAEGTQYSYDNIR